MRRTYRDTDDYQEQNVDVLARYFDSSTTGSSWTIVNSPTWQWVPRLNVRNNGNMLVMSPRSVDE
jgi:hypothetical protein